MELNEYRALFSRLHSSVREEEIVMGQKQMRRTKIRTRTAALLLAAALVLILALGAAAVYRHQLEDLFMRGGEQDTTRSESADPFGYGKVAISCRAGRGARSTRRRWSGRNSSTATTGTERSRGKRTFPTGWMDIPSIIIGSTPRRWRTSWRGSRPSMGFGSTGADIPACP